MGRLLDFLEWCCDRFDAWLWRDEAVFCEEPECPACKASAPPEPKNAHLGSALDDLLAEDRADRWTAGAARTPIQVPQEAEVEPERVRKLYDVPKPKPAKKKAAKKPRKR